MPEITLEQTGTNDIKDLVSLTSMIDRLLPDESKEVQRKLRIKIYNLSRSRNWPWVTVKKRRYYKPETANIIIGSVSDYADAIRNKVEQDKKKAAEEKAKAKENKENKPKVEVKPPVKISDIIAQATHNTNLSSEMVDKLKDRITYIAKINVAKTVSGQDAYKAEDAEQIISDLGSYYKQLRRDNNLNNKEKNNYRNNQENRQSRNQNQSTNSDNNSARHPFEIKNNHNNNNSYYRNYNNRKHSRNNQRWNNNYNNYNNNYSNSSDLQEKYNNLLRNYNDLQEKYARALDEKNNLINEKANQLFNRYNSLKEILEAVLKRM